MGERLMESTNKLECPYCEVTNTTGLRQILSNSGFILSSSFFEVSAPFIPGAPFLNTIEDIRSLIWDFLGIVSLFFSII